MLPPVLDKYMKKLASPARDRRRQQGTRRILMDLLAAMRRRFLWKLRSARVNPDYPMWANQESIASGELRDSLRLQGDYTPDRYEASVYTTAKHYDFIDTGAAEPATPLTRDRIQQWVEDRFGHPAGTDPNTIIEDPFNEGESWDTTYGDFIDGIMYAVERNLERGRYIGLDLTRVIGDTPLAPGGEQAFFRLLDWWVSFYTMDPAA